MIKKLTTDIKNRIYLKEEEFKDKKIKTDNYIKIDTGKEITNFLGFGSAITESASYNFRKLSLEKQKRFLYDYYSSDKLNLKYGRISIGSNDFSLNSFLLSHKRDLSDFSISRDMEYVIPFLKEIREYKKIKLIASPWSPPRMFKRIPILRFGFKLSKRYYERYCDYLIKFIDEYQKLGINIDYLTMQNEPMARQPWESCVFSISEQKEFIYKYLLNKLDKTKLLLWDHNKDNLYQNINQLYEESNKIAGFAFHYYTGSYFEEVKKLREKYPDKLLVNSEMCCAYTPYDEVKWLSSAEYYIHDIIGDMNSGVNIYLDWNILLDEKGGPNHAHNPVKSSSIRIGDTYLLSPIYYYLYHISHFIGDKSIILFSNTNTKLKVVSIKTNNKIIIVIMNKTDSSYTYKLEINNKKISDKIDNHSIITYEIN